MTSKPISATASSRFAAVRRVPLVTLPVASSRVAPSERGKNSYQLPKSARSRSAYAGNGPSTLTSSRIGWARSTSSRAGSCSAARRASAGRSVSCAAVIAGRSTSRPGSEAGRSARTRSSSSRPSVNISSTSTPAGIFSPASCCQVASGSDQACTSNVQAPSVSGVTQAR